MGLLDLWDYLRSTGDPRLRKQGYAGAGMGLLERYRRAKGFWEPHLENNRRNLLEIGARLGVMNLGSEEEATLALREADGVIVNLFPMTARVINALDRCKVISRYGASS